MNYLPAAGTIIPRTEQPLATWPGGTTRTIYTYPPSASGDIRAAQLYVGTATIERDGPYSVFTARTRVHLPMRGNGLQLHFKEPTATMPLQRFEQATFPGDRPLTVTLVDGMVEAFNLIFTAHFAVKLDSFTVEPGAALTLPAQANSVRILYLVEGRCSIWKDADSKGGATPIDGEEIQLVESDAYLDTHHDNAGGLLRVTASTRLCHLIVAVANVTA